MSLMHIVSGLDRVADMHLLTTVAWLPTVLEVFDLDFTQTTLLQFAYFVAYLIVAPPMGIFMRKYGYKVGIHVGLALFSIGKQLIMIALFAIY